MEATIEYMKVFMEYESDDMPVLYFYEVDLANERLARRAIEIFINRRVKRIKDLYHGVIEIVPLPTVDELNEKVWGDGFFALEITKEEFEKIWNSAVYYGKLSVE